ncbi:hypothetical protein NDK47_20835 [Brevibacillus ruminantium]|uniref:DUF3953 domain-containing protein n=1 Tax=Brevibacillus ruminantium TaxID=2950604 RepID=A0ABY4WEL3_9BACL|nr:hypothetical protein [Brevibacillus ruminantium]USG64568.1 hypothetical protein NDK47_20835 [Brevibacillus ruminantium]
MKTYPLWYYLISVLVIVIAIASLFTGAPVLRFLTTLGLGVVMASLGTFQWKKNRMMAYALFGVAALQVFALIYSIYVFVSV